MIIASPIQTECKFCEKTCNGKLSTIHESVTGCSYICIYIRLTYLAYISRENIIKFETTIYMLWTLYWVNVRKLIGTYFMKIFPKKTHLYVRNVFCFNNVLECVQVFTNQLNTLEFERISFLSWRASNWFDLEYQLFTS